jgi:hypothetical protein
MSPTSRSSRLPMRAELDPRSVAARLAELRTAYVPETIDDGQRRLAREQPRSQASIAEVAARSLSELRALCELARVLHQARPLDKPS